MKAKTAKGLRTLLRWFLGLLFVWAAVSHLANPVESLGSIYAYQLSFPESWLKLAAVVLPWIELMCGLLLLVNVWPETALVGTAALTVLFLLVTGQAWARGLNISCGCFNLSVLGISKTNPALVKFVESVGFAFFRNIVLTSICYFLLRSHWLDLKAAVATPQKPSLKPSKAVNPQRKPASVR
jgi:uncharacterized membrane protein YphA (DoxX/SURF4 family)